MFPAATVHMNYRHPDIRFSVSRMKMEFDIFVPEYSLALEYQGEQHFQYSTLWGDKTSFDLDNEKQKGVVMLHFCCTNVA
jgi:hypothetical protein